MKWILAVIVLAAVTIGYANDPNNPYLCELHTVEGFYQGNWNATDPNGLKYGSQMFREWITIPELAVDVNWVGERDTTPLILPRPSDLRWSYEWEGQLPPGIYIWFYRDYDLAGNSFWTRETWIVTLPPDTTPPVGGCSTVIGGG